MLLALALLFATLIQNAQAFYNPTTGRWLTRDPIGERGGKNLYGFVRNAPLSRFDRNGQEEGCRAVTVPAQYEDQEDQFEDRARDRVNQESGLVVFEVSTVADANAQLKTCGKCIKELNIIGHANKGFQNVASKNDPNRANTGRLSADASGNGNYTYSGMEMFNGVVFCKPCTIILRGCYAAQDAEGKALLSEVARVSGCTVKGYSNATHNGIRTDGPFPGDGPLFPGPDVTINPPSPPSPPSK